MTDVKTSVSGTIFPCPPVAMRRDVSRIHFWPLFPWGNFHLFGLWYFQLCLGEKGASNTWFQQFFPCSSFYSVALSPATKSAIWHYGSCLFPSLSVIWWVGLRVRRRRNCASHLVKHQRPSLLAFINYTSEFLISLCQSLVLYFSIVSEFWQGRQRRHQWRLLKCQHVEGLRH